MLGKDRAIKAATPRGVKFDPKHPDPDVMKAAGTRGEPLEVGARFTSAFRKVVGLHPNGEQPAYLDDPAECGTCTKGARYTQNYRGAPVELVCSNKACFEAKADRGRNKWQKWYADLLEKRDKATDARAAAIRVSLEGIRPEHVQDIARSLLIGRDFVYRRLADTGEIELSFQDSDLFANESPALARVREMLGLELPTGEEARTWDRGAGRLISIAGGPKTLEGLAAAPLEAQVEATSLLVAALSAQDGAA